MKKNLLLIFLMAMPFIESYAQTCAESTLKISSEPEHVYINDISDFSLPFNSQWGIMVENEKAIIVAFSDNLKGNAGVLKNQNGYYIQSAGSGSKSGIRQLLTKTSRSYSNIFRYTC